MVYILCRSEGREEKDRAIRQTHEAKLVADLIRLQQRAAKTTDGRVLKIKIRKGTTPNRSTPNLCHAPHPAEVMKPIKTWRANTSSDEKDFKL